MNFRSMFHKVASIFCVVFFLHFGYEGYPQTPTEQGISLEKQQEGRSLMVASTFLYGVGLYGPGTARILELDSASQITALEFLIGGGVFIGGVAITNNYRLGAGRTNLIVGGMYTGTLYGVGIPLLFEVEAENNKVYLGSMMLSTPIGGYLAYKLSSHRWYEKGESNMITLGGLVGGFYGLGIPYLINIESLETSTQTKIYAASTMIGIPVGVLTSSKLFYDKPISEGRSHLINFGGLVGSSYACGITSLFEVDSPRLYVAAAMLGLPVGTYLGYKFTDKEEYTRGRSYLIQLGAYAGALFASGFPLLMEAESHKPYVVASILGSAGGMWLAHHSTRGWGESAPLARNDHIPQSGKFKVSLPSVNEWFTFSLMAIRKPTFMADFPVELVRITF